MSSSEAFNLQEEEKFIVIQFPSLLDKETAEKMRNNMQNWLLKPVDVFFFDFKKVLNITQDAIVLITQFQRLLTKNDKHLFSLNLSKSLIDLIREKGLNNVFSPVESTEDGLKKAGLLKTPKKKVKLDVQFINPFIEGACETLKTQAQVSVSPQKPFVKKGPLVENISVAGLISIESKHFKGSIALCFPKKTFLNIYNSMLGEEISELDNEVKDAAAELLNIIYGYAKRIHVDQNKIHMEKAIPTVLSGDNLSLDFKTKAPVLILPFQSSAGPFHIEIFIEDT
ncbi:MAG: hypothetical protein D6797_05775 [Bdellovibrio sp.]|nr:MAG: hypothetical protein D6797_05775 [Bdellovibrio sp.]